MNRPAPAHFRMLAALCCGLVCFGPLTAAVLYEDNFNGKASAPLVGRAPDTVNTPKASYLGSNLLVADGAGRLVTKGANHAISLPLPALKDGDVVTLTADVRASGAASSYIGIGFTDTVATLSGFAELMVSVRSDGAGRVFLGKPNDNNPLYLKPANLAGARGNVTEPVRLVLTLDTGSRRLSVMIGATKVFDDTIAYSTPGRLNHVTLQFAAQNNATAEVPAYVDYLKVEVSPAP